MQLLVFQDMYYNRKCTREKIQTTISPELIRLMKDELSDLLIT